MSGSMKNSAITFEKKELGRSVIPMKSAGDEFLIESLFKFSADAELFLHGTLRVRCHQLGPVSRNRDPHRGLSGFDKALARGKTPDLFALKVPLREKAVAGKSDLLTCCGRIIDPVKVRLVLGH